MAKELTHRDEICPCRNPVNEYNIISNIPNTPLLSEIFHHSLPHWRSKVLFKGWKFPQKRWKEWVHRLAGKYAAVWNQAGICDAIMSSIFEVHCNQDLVLGVSEFWCSETNTFVFPWGEATVTLEDMMILGGLPVIGEPVSSPLDDEMMKIVEELEKQRVEVCRSRSKKAAHCVWIACFMEEKSSELEHVGFLSLWLSRFVFPSLSEETVGKHVFPIAVKLSQGKQVTLGPAVLASIYRDLGLLKEGILSSKKTISVSAPFHLLQLWAFEHFSLLGPRSPNPIKRGEPRVARWHKLTSKVDNLPLVRSALQVGGNFEWCPYAANLENWRNPSYYEESEQRLFVDSSLDAELSSFFKCLQACELVGVDCVEDYFPHRVAMQFGLDQDLPSDTAGYDFATKNVNFIVPPRTFQSCASERYIKWWKDMMSTRKVAIKGVLMKGKYSKIISAAVSIEAKGNRKDYDGLVASTDPVNAITSSQVSAKSSTEVSHPSVCHGFNSKKGMKEFFGSSDDEFTSEIYAAKSKNSSIQSKESRVDRHVSPSSSAFKNGTKQSPASAKLDSKGNHESKPPDFQTVTTELCYSDLSDDDNIPIGLRFKHGLRRASQGPRNSHDFPFSRSKIVVSSDSKVFNEYGRKRKSHDAAEGNLQGRVKKEPADSTTGKEVDGMVDTTKKVKVEEEVQLNKDHRKSDKGVAEARKRMNAGVCAWNPIDID